MKNSSAATKLQRALLLFLFLLVPSLAQAHPGGVGHTHGVTNGLLHPLTGLDHICAMLAVGLWAAQRGGRAVWLVPLTFVSVMALGGLLGASGISLPFVEQAIAASVLILGLLIAASVRLPLVASALLVGAFAIFHGYAHGAEMPATAAGFGYGLGFLVATALLHGAGIAIGLTAKNWSGERFVRLAGGAIAACGLALCFA